MNQKILSADAYDEKRLTAEERKKREYAKANLPHIFMPHYKWSRQFINSTNTINLLTAANQIGKSVVLIRKNILWATNKNLWPSLWKTRPTQFWYFYPSFDILEAEFDEKWVKEILPRGLYEKQGQYAWRLRKNKAGRYSKIEFVNTGVSIYFHSYEQKPSNLQASSVYMITCDEEMPFQFWFELWFRRSATKGYFCSGFTATLSQEFWRQAMEVKGKHERFPDAFKLQVSKYDCLEYEDGSPSHITKKDIEDDIAACKSEQEIQRRIYGRFVKDTNRMFEGFQRERNLIDNHPLPEKWTTYAGIDYGTGSGAHPPAIVFIRVNEKFTMGRVVLMWKGIDKVYTAGDILDKFIRLKANFPNIVSQTYDAASRDMMTIAMRMGVPLQKADKDRVSGIGLLNTLFVTGALKIMNTEYSEDLCIELENASSEMKRKDNDDLADALRYAAMAVPWDFAKISPPPKGVATKDQVVDTRSQREINYENSRKSMKAFTDSDELEGYFEEVNHLYGNT